MIIHETSIVHSSSKIDDSVEIGPFCIVGENVEIKKDTKLISHVAVSYTHLTLPTIYSV